MAEPRVLMTADTVGGVWSYALTLARALEPAEIVLATMGAPLSDAQWAEVERVRGLRVVESRYRLEWMCEPWPDVARAADWLLDLAHATRPEIVHLNGYAHGALPWPAPVLMVGHSDVRSWFRAVRRCEAGPEWARYSAEVARGLSAAQVVVAPTAAMLASLRADYGPFAASAVVPNGVEAERFQPASKRPYIFAAGRLWDDAKNLLALEAVAPRVSWPIVVAGSCDHPDGGTRTPARVECLGETPRDKMPPLFAEASIYALPARYEPFGLSALEAALSGCALVLGDIPTLRELWDGAAEFVPPDDHGALAATLERLVGDAAARARLAARAHRRGRELTPARMATSYRALYQALLASTPKGAACA